MQSKKILPFILFIAVLTLKITVVQAQFYTGPISAAMGGSGRAGNNPSESGFLNPATLAQLKNYYGGISADWGDHPIEGTTNDFAGYLADGTSDKAFPGQFSYVKRRVSLPNGFATNLQDFQLGVAYAAGPVFGLGLSGHYQTYQDNLTHSYTQTNATIGTLFAPLKQFTFAFVAYDILGGYDSVPQAYQTIPTWAVAATYKFEKSFNFNVDVVRPDKFNDGNRMNYDVGLETFFSESFALRAGWQWREVGFEEKLFSLGLGYKGPRLSFDYAFQKDVLVGSGYRQFVDLWLHF